MIYGHSEESRRVFSLQRENSPIEVAYVVNMDLVGGTMEMGSCRWSIPRYSIVGEGQQEGLPCCGIIVVYYEAGNSL